MKEIEHRATPAGELGHEDDIDLACLSKRQDFLPFGPIVSGARSGLLPGTGDLVAGLFLRKPVGRAPGGHRSDRPSIPGNSAAVCPN
jgi:hypothetical protein